MESPKPLWDGPRLKKCFAWRLPEPDDAAQESLDKAVQNRGGSFPAPTESQAHRPEPPSSIASIRPEKILIVDDNRVVLKILKNILESQNYLTVSASNGMEALKIAFQEKPDLIITDYMMPEMDGMALITKLKSQTGHPFYSHHHADLKG